MADPALPSEAALDEVQRLAGPAATIASVVNLKGGQHAATWRVETEGPRRMMVVRQFPAGDSAAAHEAQVLRMLDGFGNMAPVLLASDLTGRWSDCPTTIISWLDGEADIMPSDPDAWAAQLGRVLAQVHAVPGDRLAGLPSVCGRRSGSRAALAGPAAEEIRSRWPQIAAAPDVLAHCDYWSGNVVWRHGVLTGIVDWSGAARGPRGFDVGWCRLDLCLLFDQRVAGVFLSAYEEAIGRPLGDIGLWDGWALARSCAGVTSWAPNYQPLGRVDLDERELRRRHSQLTSRLLDRT